MFNCKREVRIGCTLVVKLMFGNLYNFLLCEAAQHLERRLGITAVTEVLFGVSNVRRWVWGEPGSEAHGGYTFCAAAALQLTGALRECDMAALRGWLVRRQMSYEGGFQGRRNKLVDGCYSFWQAGAIAILNGVDDDPWQEGRSDQLPPSLCNEAMLQRYILLCAQDVNGGLRDKPSTPRDFYHSCYNLSGLSVSQHYGEVAFGHKPSSLVAKTHPCFNIRIDRATQILNHFAAP
jgi:protein farnesyltransferase subunit beta